MNSIQDMLNQQQDEYSLQEVLDMVNKLLKSLPILDKTSLRKEMSEMTVSMSQDPTTADLNRGLALSQGFKDRLSEIYISAYNDYKIKRENIDSYYMQMAYLTSTRSTCIRRKVGCVIVRDNMILSSGYNGMPKHLSHCSKHTCIRLINNIPSGQQPNKCLGAHSEMN